MMTTLNKYRENIYSQNGEDGVLREVINRLDIGVGQFVEFGAWDGKHLSNTFHLLEQGWSGVYIEGNEDRFQQLEGNMKKFPGHSKVINAYVQPSGAKSLDSLLQSTNLQIDFDVLSIDVDSYDWHIWESLRNYAPKVVIIEINSSIPVGILQTHRGPKVQGSSFTSTVDLGASKGYTLVCHTGNLFFVLDSLVSKLDIPKMELSFPELLFDYGWKLISDQRNKTLVP